MSEPIRNTQRTLQTTGVKLFSTTWNGHQVRVQIPEKPKEQPSP